ncbi:MAG: hypothetical protein QNJ31_05085 [Candidatus Caenarcaniphilales bacterium]|nr:hypothetical protein [Candidatus Caenarcaniphilales bacterium]
MSNIKVFVTPRFKPTTPKFTPKLEEPSWRGNCDCVFAENDTRVIFGSTDKEGNCRMDNCGSSPVLVLDELKNSSYDGILQAQKFLEEFSQKFNLCMKCLDNFISMS